MTVFDHQRALWMWEFSQQAEKTLADACATAQAGAGASVLLVKAMDGTDWMSLYDPTGYASLSQFQADQAAASAQGITVVPWVVPHGQDPAAEAAAHAQLGPVLMVDLEPYTGFWTGPNANLAVYFEALRTGGVKELHVSIDPRATALAALQSSPSWSIYVDAFHPQLYWTTFGTPALSVVPLLQALQGYAAVYPVLPGDGAATDLLDVWNAAQQLGCQGVSVWRLGSMNAQQLSAFAALSLPAAPAPGPSLADRVTALETELSRLNTVLARRFSLVMAALDPANPPA